MIGIVRVFGPVFTFLFSMHALKMQELSSAFICSALGVLMLSLYRSELATCLEEIERRRKALVGDRPLRGLTRHAFILYLALSNGSHKTAAFFMVTGIGGIAAGIVVLLEAL